MDGRLTAYSTPRSNRIMTFLVRHYLAQTLGSRRHCACIAPIRPHVHRPGAASRAPDALPDSRHLHEVGQGININAGLMAARALDQDRPGPFWRILPSVMAGPV